MLCGVFGVFTACSDDLDSVTGDADNNNPVAEEVETVLAIAANVDNGNFATRAADSEDEDNHSALVRELAVAAFYVNNGEPGNLISLQTMDLVVPDDQDGKEDLGYYMNPIKFKIAPDSRGVAKIAIVALANYGNLFEIDGKKEDGKKEDEQNSMTFESFIEITTAKMYNNYGTNYFIGNGEFESMPMFYPMSSNVIYYDVSPGKVNSIGYKESSNALVFTNKYYNNSSEDSRLTEANVSSRSMINLYRGAAEIELRSLEFKDYGDMKFDNFILEEVFVMNVPTMVNWFDPTLPTAEQGYTPDWGGDLNVDFTKYASSTYSTEIKSFLSGNRRVNPSDLTGSISFKAGEFCSEEMFDYTSRNVAQTATLMIPHNKGAVKNGNYRDGAVDSKLKYFSLDQNTSISNDVYGRFLNESILEYSGNVVKTEDLGINKYSMRKKVQDSGASGASGASGIYSAYKFAVSPSNYSLGENGLDSERAICLVVRGRYYYRSGNQIIGPDNNNYSDSRYYTVVVNEKGESAGFSGVPEHYNCVRRNVRYEISLTISGPGSETPWGYDKNSYVVPKVRIVPFGVVEQDSKFD